MKTYFQSLNSKTIQANILAGLTVGIIALPLSMALAIATGVPPQHGLYTAIIGGALIAIFGGSKVSISGPTAAFIVILVPIVNQFGLAGLVISGMMAGVILVVMGLVGLGNLIRIVPYPLIIGFTSGIAVVIATLQVKDFFGLEINGTQDHYVENVQAIIRALPSIKWPEFVVATLTLVVMFTWPKLKTRIPAHLIALAVASFAAAGCAFFISDFQVATIGSRFQYDINGVIGHGIPPLLPQWQWPWELTNAQGQAFGLTFSTINSLLSSAFAIAILGALESLLCATVADGMAGTQHDPNRELVGQGIGNIAVPFFGGIPATAAIARTATNIRAGGTNALSSVVHSLVILSSIIFLAPFLSYIPMASMAALLVVVAWNMSEAKHFVRTLKSASTDDIAVLLTSFGLTVFFNIEIAVAVGFGLAAVLFIKRSIEITEARAIDKSEAHHLSNLPSNVVVYDINGPLFFGAAHRAMSELLKIQKDIRAVVLDMTDVTMLDMTAIVALESMIKNFEKNGVMLVINGLKPALIVQLRKAGMRRKKGKFSFSRTISEAIRKTSNHFLFTQHGVVNNVS